MDIAAGFLRDRRPGMRLDAYPGPSQTETPFAIPDTALAPFPDDAATGSDFAYGAMGRAGEL